ncbi:MAG: UDP-N-acetylmuramoyl-L-alanyl-D-glutamate--2,6-diaminopimelate ligase [Paludibacteraceae bacterium]|nr:UDP-N-acetylmuramoyl-L-alanyl-D-glutamate--2,6-diaminopimelate ligase [Paludibacteraceae bacterium]
MILSEILKGVKVLTNLTTDVAVKNICFDSRKVAEGDVFVATRGTAVDGHDFVTKAVEQGAVAVVCETLPEKIAENVVYVQVADSADALGIMASNFYENPSQNLTLVGVTGTNGKTTIATLLYQLFRALGFKVGLLSTVCNYIDDEAVESTHTTPNALELNALLARMVDAGCEYAFMEVSSHSVEQRRIAGLQFRGGIFTNLTRDHLDYHKTVENYLKAKKRFFDELPKTAFALTNADDKNGEVMLQNCAAEKKTYSLRTLANFKTRILENSFEGMLLQMNELEVMMPFVGKFNAANLSAVFGAAVLLGFDELEVLTKLSSLKSVSGRFETIRNEGITAIVDYAHTPDALNNVISTINDIRAGQGNLITVVGCGGNRDKGKRPMMAREAVNGSNRVILTSDNPRDEEPQDILNDMLEGVDASERRKVLVIADRREAIKTACALAQNGDVILVAGKGHENYQIIKGIKHHFDDKEEIQLALNNQ